MRLQPDVKLLQRLVLDSPQAGGVIHHVLEVIEDQHERHPRQELGGQQQALPERLRFVPKRCGDFLVAGHRRLHLHFFHHRLHRAAGAAGGGFSFLANGLHGHKVEPARFQASAHPGRQGAFPLPTHALQQGERDGPLPQRRDQLLLLAAAADEPLAQPDHPVGQQFVLGLRTLVLFRRQVRAKRAVRPARAEYNWGRTNVSSWASWPWLAFGRRPSRWIRSLAKATAAGTGSPATSSPVEGLGEGRGPLVGHAGRPAQGQRQPPFHQRLAQARHGRLHRLATVDEHASHLAAGENFLHQFAGRAGIGAAGVILETKEANPIPKCTVP